MSEKLVFPEFDDIKVSTKTYTATTNINIDLEKLSNILPITPYVVIPKKRGRKKKSDHTEYNKDVKPGSIVTIKYENIIRGVELKPKKNKNNDRKKWFRNSVTIVIILDKPINFKVCRNGTFQMTGCKNENHPELCVKYIWDYIKEHKDMYTFMYNSSLQVLFIPSMRNIDFSVGFIVDREKLNNYMCYNEDVHCLLETSFGYTGVNIKVPLKEDISLMEIRKITYGEKDIKYETTIYQEYLELLTPKEKISKLKKEKYNTFLVFHSGKVIMSGLTSEFMKNTYYYFLNIIRDSFEHIEERLLI